MHNLAVLLCLDLFCCEHGEHKYVAVGGGVFGAVHAVNHVGGQVHRNTRFQADSLVATGEIKCSTEGLHDNRMCGLVVLKLLSGKEIEGDDVGMIALEQA